MQCTPPVISSNKERHSISIMGEASRHWHDFSAWDTFWMLFVLMMHFAMKFVPPSKHHFWIDLQQQVQFEKEGVV